MISTVTKHGHEAEGRWAADTGGEVVTEREEDKDARTLELHGQKSGLA